MSVMRTFVGYYIETGERVVRVCNPLGLFEAFFLENSEGPMAGVQIPKGDIVAEMPEEFAQDRVSDDEVDKQMHVFERMEESNEKWK
jgi:hypothetical protein